MKSINVRGVEFQVDERGKFAPRRPNLWAIQIGYWLGRGYSAKAVAAIVGDGTTEGTVKGQARRAQVLPARARETIVPVHLPSWQRDMIQRCADERDLTLDQIICHVLESALVFDDLYDAVTDGRYDRKAQKSQRAA
ncbi:hypothetical protein [Devosia sp.]|uniref:hypothetical protein n=1 Tax=Devosia sp. TaxID=1871048 RepID=UPI0032664F1E